MVDQEKDVLLGSSDNICMEVFVWPRYDGFAFAGDCHFWERLQYAARVTVSIQLLEMLIKVDSEERSLESSSQLRLERVVCGTVVQMVEECGKQPLWHNNSLSWHAPCDVLRFLSHNQ